MIEAIFTNLKILFNLSILGFLLILLGEFISGRIKKFDKISTDLPVIVQLREISKRRKTNCLLCAHRGGRTMGHENTTKTFLKCIKECSPDLIELDLNMTKDKKTIICHDNIIVDKDLNKHDIRSKTLEELRKLNFEEDKIIPTFDEVLNALSETKCLSETSIVLILDFKAKEIIEDSLNVVSRYNLSERIILAANDITINRALLILKKSYMPVIVDMTTMFCVFILSKLRLLGFFPLQHDIYGSMVKCHGINAVDKSLVKAIHNRNKLFAIIGEEMNKIDIMKKMIDYKVDILLTDSPEILKPLIDEK